MKILSNLSCQHGYTKMGGGNGLVTFLIEFGQLYSGQEVLEEFRVLYEDIYELEPGFSGEEFRQSSSSCPMSGLEKEGAVCWCP